MKTYQANICILLAGIMWGTIGLFVRYLNRFNISSVEMVFLRAIIACFVFGIYLFIKDKKLFRIKIKDCWIFLGSGILCFTCFNILYFNTISISSLSIAAVLLYTSPIFVMLFSALLFKETLNKRKLFCLLLAFAGSVLVSGIVKGDGSISFLGFLMGICSGLTYGLYSIFCRYGLNRYSTITVTFYTFLFATIGLLCTTNVPILIEKIQTPSLLLVCLSLGVFTCVLPYILYNTGLRHTETGKAAILACIEPVMATLCSTVILKENFNLTMFGGIFLVITAIVLLNIKSKMDKKTTLSEIHYNK